MDIIKKLTSLVSKYRKQQSIDESRDYYALSPVDEPDNCAEYYKALKWAILNRDIKNIALSGPYGSGKSSIIKGFLKKKLVNVKPLFISLAAFNYEIANERKERSGNDDGQSDTKSSQGDNDSLINQLEEKILEQILYSVSMKDLPQSRFRKIAPHKKGSNLFFSLILELIVVCIFIFFAPEKVSVFIAAINSLSNIKVFIFLLVVILVFGICFFVVKLFRNNMSIQEIKIMDMAIKRSLSDQEKNIFNKHLDEIIYYFESNKTNLVIFEDLDRYNNTEIFVALRELNRLINNYNNIEEKVTFLYAIRDDMFVKEGERTKFFDFIIPVIPYVSSTNSEEILRKLLGFERDSSESKRYNISERYVSLISPYLSDMRQIISICNEFDIYKNTLKENQELQLIDENMFSLIVFKNVYPLEFAKLEDEAEDSLIKKAFESKNNFLSSLEKDIKSKKNELSSLLEDSTNNPRFMIIGVKIALLNTLVGEKSRVSYINMGGKNYFLEDILADSFDIEDMNSGPVTIVYKQQNYSDQSKTFNKDELDLLEYDYFGRIEQLKRSLEIEREEANEKLESYESQMWELKTATIQQLIHEKGTEFLAEEVKDNDLLVFFLRYGYIDEHSADYIYYFHPNSITKDEMNFVLDIRNRRPENNYNTSLKHVGRIFNKIDEAEFKQKILNYDLTDYLLREKTDTTAFRFFIEQLSDQSQESIDFINAYIDRGINQDLLIQQLCHESPYFWKSIVKNETLSLDSRLKYLNLVFQNVTLEDIVRQDNLSDFILSEPDVLNRINNIDSDKQINVFKELNIKFNDVCLDLVDEKVKAYIFDNKCFVINGIMLRRLLEWKYPCLVSDLEYKNYSVLRSIDDQGLLEYVLENFSTYVNDLVVGVPTNTKEEIDAVEDIIERLITEDIDLCIKVLDKEHVIWQSIDSCCSNVVDECEKNVEIIWNYLLENNRIECKWENVVTYYKRFGTNSYWCEYIDKHIEKLVGTVNDDIMPEDMIEDILLSKISAKSFSAIVKRVPINECVNKQILVSITPEKVRILIEENIMPYKPELFNAIEEVLPDYKLQYASNNKEMFIASLDEIELMPRDICVLLQMDLFCEEEKKLFLEKLDVNDIDIELAKSIRDLTFEIEKRFVVRTWDVLPEELKYQLLLNQLNVIPDDELPNFFNELAPEYHKLGDRSRHKYVLDDNEYNNSLLKKLERRNYVTSLKVKSAGIDSSGNEIRVLSGYVKEKRV